MITNNKDDDDNNNDTNNNHKNDNSNNNNNDFYLFYQVLLWLDNYDVYIIHFPASSWLIGRQSGATSWHIPPRRDFLGEGRPQVSFAYTLSSDSRLVNVINYSGS